MTENQAKALREKLLAHRARLLDLAVRQVETDPTSLGWLRSMRATLLPSARPLKR